MCSLRSFVAGLFLRQVLLFLPGEDAQRLLKNAGPLALEDLPGPVKSGTAQEPDEDVADVLFVRFEVLRVAFEMVLEGADIPERLRFEERLCGFVPNGI